MKKIKIIIVTLICVGLYYSAASADAPKSPEYFMDEFCAYKRMADKIEIDRYIVSKSDIWQEMKKIGEYFKTKLNIPEPKYPYDIEFIQEYYTGVLLTEKGWLLQIGRKYINDLPSNFELAHALTHELVHVQGFKDESITDTIALAIISEIAKDENNIYKKSLYGRLADQIYYAPIYLILYKEAFPIDHIDMVAKYFSALNIGNGYYYDPDHGDERIKDYWPDDESGINKWVEMNKNSGLIKEGRDEFIRKLKIRFSPHNQAETKFKSMQYGFLPYNIIRRAMSNNNIITESEFDSYPKIFKGLNIDALAGFIKTVK